MARMAHQDSIGAYAVMLDQLWHETVKQPHLKFLSYLIGMAALVAEEEARRSRAPAGIIAFGDAVRTSDILSKSS